MGEIMSKLGEFDKAKSYYIEKNTSWNRDYVQGKTMNPKPEKETRQKSKP